MTNDVAARMRALATRPGGGTFTANHEPSMWLRTRLVDLRTRLATGQLSTCPHLSAGDVGTIALWAPDRAVCTPCAKTELALTGPADRTCDRCTHIVDRIHPEIVAPAPNVVVLIGLCPPCHRKELGRPAPPTLTEKEARP